MPTTPRGRFVWHEVMTTAPDAATDFYSKVVGWQPTAWEQDSTYRFLTMNGTPMAGLMLQPDEVRASGAPPYWLTYIGVPDVDAASAQASRLGATVYVHPRDIPTVGRFAVLGDPHGAVFAVFKSATEHRGSEEFTLGDFSWHELATTDWRAAWDFYRAMFGWEHHSSVDMGAAGTYWMFKGVGGKGPRGGMYTKPREMPAPPHWMPYVLVPSADRAAELAKRHGGQILNGPMDVPGGDRVAQLMDPQGGAFAVHSLGAPAEPAAKPRAKKRAAPRKRVQTRAANKKKRKGAKPTRARKHPAPKKAARKTARRKSARPPKPKERR